MKLLSGLKVLVVDDEPDLRELFEIEFEMAGAKVLNAENGKEAIEVVEANEIDLVVTDLRMPIGNGVELLENIRKHHRFRPELILATGFADITVSQLYDRGGCAMFNKPFDWKGLLRRAKEVTKPKREKWSEPAAGGDQTVELEASFISLDNAVQQGAFKLGRSGFFFAMKDHLPERCSPVHFFLKFAEGDLREIEGFGEIRWVRRPDDREAVTLPTGLGIEIDAIRPDLIEPLLEKIEKLKLIAYIPAS